MGGERPCEFDRRNKETKAKRDKKRKRYDIDNV